MRAFAARDHERGATLVLMAIALALSLGMAALAIDYGMIKAKRAEAQRAVDASALAGASVFLISDPVFNKSQGAVDTAMKYAVLHKVGLSDVDPTEITVTPDVPNTTVKVDFMRTGIRTWFANTFGIATMGIRASATAHVEGTDVADCVKPVAIPDMWDNAPNVSPPKKGKPGTEQEDLNGNHAWDYQDANGNGVWDDGETEPWVFSPGKDTYDPGTTGYGSVARDPYGTLVKDYGRQMFLMSFSPKDNTISSMYYAWGHSTAENSAISLAQRILGGCEKAGLGTTYDASNGAKLGQVPAAWDELINRDPDARWNDALNTVEGSNANADWLDGSPRVITVGLYDPTRYANSPSNNKLQFVNLAKVFLDKRTACAGGIGGCKQPLTGHFLGFVNGSGPGGAPAGTLVKRLVLIK